MSFSGKSAYNTAAINTDVVITLTGVDASTAPTANCRHMIKGITWSLTADPAAPIAINVKDSDGTVLSSIDVSAKGPGYINYADKGLPCTVNLNTVITLDLATDSNTVGKLTVLYDFA